MDRTVPLDDRNSFFPPERQSTLGLTLGMFGTVLVATIVAAGLFAVQLGAFASTRHADPGPVPFLDPIEAFGETMHPDPLPYGAADPDALSMIERAADGIAAEGSI